MKSKKLLILAFVTVVAIVAATIISQQRAPTTKLEKQLLFPGLAEQINDVQQLVVNRHDGQLTLSNTGSQWVIQEADDYPADFGKIRSNVIAVSELRILAEKTSNPERYERLGVRDPETEGADSLLLTLVDSNNDELASLVVGNTRHSKSADDSEGLYVRLPNKERALLVEGMVDISADVKDWIERDLFDIPATRVKQIEIKHADGEQVLLSRDSDVDDLNVHDIPDGREPQSSVIITRMGTLLEDIFIDNVRASDSLAAAIQSTATVHTFDGLIVTIENAVIDEKVFSSFHFSVAEGVDAAATGKGTENEEEKDAPDPVKEAEELNKRLSGWSYEIPQFKFELFDRRPGDLTREIKTEEEAEAPPAVSE